MILTLRERAAGLRERMDDPTCDSGQLARTYAQFALINRLLSGWPQVYRQLLRPLLTRERSFTLLDVGCGGGDLARQLTCWAARDGFQLKVLGIDPDPRAIGFARSRSAPPTLTFRQASSGELVREGRQFDLVISNHVLHHLEPAELAGLLEDTRHLARGVVIHSDLVRSVPAYVLFSVLGRAVFRRSFIVEDGLISIRRSYTTGELRDLSSPGWTARRLGPFRHLLVYDGSASS